MRKIYTLLTPPERGRALTLLGLMVVGMVMETLGIGAVIPAIGLLTRSDFAMEYPRLRPLLATLGNPGQVQLVAIGMLSLVGLYFIKSVFLSFLFWRQTKFAYDVQAHLSYRLFTTYLSQPWSFHLQRNSAELIRNAITEVSQFTFSVLLPSLLLVTEGLVLLGIAGLLLAVEPLGAIITVLALGATFWGFHRVMRARIVRWGKARQHHEGLRIQHLQQGLGGAKDVKLLGREGEFLSQYQEHNVQSARFVQFQVTLQQIPRLWLDMIAVLGLTTLVLTMIAQGREVGEVLPALALFAAAAFRLMPSVNRILVAVQSLRYGLPVINVLHDELAFAGPEYIPDGEACPFESRVELTDVTYAYPEAPAPALTGLSMTVQNGESVGVIGPSGSGKSTLVDVLLGLLTPTLGKVSVDQQDIQVNLRGWQDQIGYVPQSVYLTDDTLRRNVAFGLSDGQIDEAAVWRAIEAAQLNEFVSSLPEGLEVLVGERGVRISGGQRQRIGIARALYHDPQVLVLDEATSSLDTATEEGLMDAVRALHGSKTIIIVSHRLSTVEHCDRIYRLHQGRVAEEGLPAMVLGAAANKKS